MLDGSTYDHDIYRGGQTGYGSVVVDATNPGIDGTYCISGATTFENCDHKVSSLNAELCDQGGCTPNLVRTGKARIRLKEATPARRCTAGIRTAWESAGMHLGGSLTWAYVHKYNSIAYVTGFSAAICPSCVP